MEKWQQAEEMLNRAERAERKRRAVLLERQQLSQKTELKQVLADESLDPDLFRDSFPDMSARTGEELGRLEEQVQRGLGRVPQRGSQGKYGDLPLHLGRNRKHSIQIESQFPPASEDSDAWRMAGFREAEFYAGMEEYIALQKRVQRARAQSDAMGVLASRLEREMGTITPTIRGEVREKRKKMRELEKKMRILKQESPEVFVGAHLAELRSYRRDLGRGRIADVPYAQEQKRKVTACIRTGTPMFLHGHLGAGKTEVAIAAAREYLASRSDEEIGRVIQEDMNRWLTSHPSASEAQQTEAREMFAQEARGPLIISGSKKTHPSELYGHRTLSIKEFFTEEKLQSLGRAMKAFRLWKADNPGAPEDETTMQWNGLLKAYMDDPSGTFSAFFLGPIYRAMRDGRPIIIDEANYIDAGILGSLNFILTRKVGDTVSVQQDSGEKIQIKRGFCILMTGNFPSDGEEELYLGRSEMDAAFLSRLEKLKYDYLPQSLEPNLADAMKVSRKKTPEFNPVNLLNYEFPRGASSDIVEHDLEQAGAFLSSDLFKLIIARTMDRYGNMELPDGSVEKLWKLAVFARKTQDIFSGKFSDADTGERGLLRAALGKDVVSLRHIDRILTAWKNDSMQYELDHYIFESVVAQASGDKERTALYKIAQDVGLFSDTEGWMLSQDIASGAGVAKISLKSPKNRVENFVWYSPRDTVRFVFGPEPERTKFPVGENSDDQPNPIEQMEILQSFERNIKNQNKELTEDVREYWQDECANDSVWKYNSPSWGEAA